ncbi:MAG: DUF1778 domain-containing protein, partial [Pseudomonadota bacterium]
FDPPLIWLVPVLVGQSNEELEMRKAGRDQRPKAPEGVKTSTMQIRVTPDERELLDKASQITRRSRSGFVVWAALEAAELVIENENEGTGEMA